MSLQVNLQSVCMIFDTLNNIKNIFVKSRVVERLNKITSCQLEELFFDNCTYCKKMAAVPQSAFAVRKFQERYENNHILSIKSKNSKDYNYSGTYRKNLFEERELTPMKYSSKLMNSIWGLYNRYSVHNFKKNNDAEASMITAALGSVLLSSTSPTAASTQTVTEVAVKSHVLNH